jgi:hypothetical protein
MTTADHTDRSIPGPTTHGTAVAALTLGAVGLFMFNVLCGPAAITLGTLAARRGRDRTRTVGFAAIALGVADLLILAALVLVRIDGGVFHWRLG